MNSPVHQATAYQPSLMGKDKNIHHKKYSYICVAYHLHLSLSVHQIG